MRREMEGSLQILLVEVLVCSYAYLVLVLVLVESRE